MHGVSHLNQYKKLFEASLGLLIIGFLVTMAGLFKAYDLVGRCTVGTQGCRLTHTLGTIAVIGSWIVVISFYASLIFGITFVISRFRAHHQQNLN